MTTQLENAWAGVEVLHELLNTPNMKSLHFELDVAIKEIPTVRYTIERNAIWDKFVDGVSVDKAIAIARGEKE